MKRLLLSLVCVLGLLGGLRAQEAETISIGSGDGYVRYSPTASDKYYSVTQQIFTAEEMQNKSGKITSVTFKCVKRNVTRKFAVYMVNTNKLSFENATDWVAVAATDLVYEGELSFSAGNETTITFTNPFTYKKGQNVLLCVNDITTKGDSYTAQFASEGRSESRMLYANTWSGEMLATNLSGVAGTLSSNINQVQFTLVDDGSGEELDPAPDAPANLKAETLSDTEIQLTWDAVEGATYNVYQKDVEEAITKGLATTTYTVANLTPGTNYCFTVTAAKDLESKKSEEACAETKSRATTFAFDFNDGIAEMRVFKGAESTSHNWASPKDYPLADMAEDVKNYYKGVDGTMAVYSLTYDILEDKTYTPDNYIVTVKPYLITETSTIEWDIRQAEDAKTDQYSIVISEDGTNFTDVWFERYSDKTGATKAYSLAAYAGKEIYIGFRHYKKTNGGALCLDNVKLVTDSQLTPETPVDPTAPTIPDNVKAVAFSESTIKLTWNAAENALSYNIYQGEDVVATSVTETSYMVEGLEAGTNYCFTVTAVNEEVSSTTEDPYNGYEYVDLGLPSGLKWATCNIGASEPEECGNYYAWGETITKNQYNEQTSLVWGQRLDDISGNPQYDAASANWGGKWRMPTKDEMEELLTECNWEQTTMNDVVGYKFASKTNDNYIFLPSAGMYSVTNIASVGVTLSYWSSTSEWEDLAGYAQTYLLNDFMSEIFGPIRVSQIIKGHTGLPVRPVSGGNFVYDKESAKSSEVCATTFEAKPEAPAAPSNLKAEALTESTIKLTWDAVEGAKIYNVYQGIVKLLSVSETTHIATSLQAGREYCFTVTAVNDGGESAKSEEVCATTLVEEGVEKPATPQNFTMKALVKNELKLSWDAVEGATEYNIYEGDEVIGTVTVTSFDMTDLDSNREYCFELTAVNDGGESDKTEEVCEITLADEPEPEVPGEGVEENAASFNVYPNPVNDRLYIETEAEIEEVVVYDVYGRVQNLRNSETQKLRNSIDVTNLNSGIYFVKVVTANGETVKRFIKD